MSNVQLKSKRRVANHGEVFTNDREVKAMLDLVRPETERIDSRFLEPACGTGNFLVEVLQRKLVVLQRRYPRSQLEYERNGIVTVGSIYGIDLLPDNVSECQQRLFKLFTEAYTGQFKTKAKSIYLENIEFVIEHNILLGNALTLRQPDNGQPIIFAEWSAAGGSMIKRRDYTMANLLENQPVDGMNLFSDLGDSAFIPKPVAEYSLTHYLKLKYSV
jgi:hypothetical protein